MELSRKFGAAQWYACVEDGGCGDWWGWCIAEYGKVQRYFYFDWNKSVTGSADIGTVHPLEQGLLLEPIEDWLRDNGFPADAWVRHQMLEGYDYDDHENGASAAEALAAIWRRFQQRTGIPDVATPFRIADRASVSPAQLGPHNRVQGHGVLALTACGRRTGHRGALPISLGR